MWGESVALIAAPANAWFYFGADVAIHLGCAYRGWSAPVQGNGGKDPDQEAYHEDEDDEVIPIGKHLYELYILGGLFPSGLPGCIMLHCCRVFFEEPFGPGFRINITL